MACSGLHCAWLLMVWAKQWNSCQIIHIIEIMEKWVNVLCAMLICFMSFFSLPSLPPFPIHFSLYLSHPLSPSLLSSPSLSLLLPLYFQYNQCLSWRCFKVCQHSLTLWSWQELSHTGGLWATNKSQYTHTHTHLCTYTSPQLHAHAITLFCTPTCELHAWI